jgi:hypothetical protein
VLPLLPLLVVPVGSPLHALTASERTTNPHTKAVELIIGTSRSGDESTHGARRLAIDSQLGERSFLWTTSGRLS